ncbi:bifunctional diguanylate cyclase/phosphodiesterase [Legionella pneumophila]|uniref:bifunctional diguanylate cyclase/phosphodiesterase n=1 Tax=Legionella pneumophila TaxID=446 RepID=UPI000E081A1E|nr:bifunctional diguanylate cyclase/phosphodiesterase [Legionella pneumophila]HAT9040995.1 EAL domain-containing protein [Legionella pneumophila subsp. pneumophila]MCK1848749.1 EAL domain-containing protein [Legionella pneumophila]MDI9851898.1 EAL domain-containing protein [Legionella pneumophila]STX89752.1 signal transduction protein containing a membrane domain, an EAL and a GGDEF domain [Legionella pneumophila]HAT1703578.1 EAL domain-containing protein [Legionella pneumophila]
MRRQEINYEKVAKAAEKIKKRGIEPSVNEIRDELGLVGNHPQLSILLEEWYHNQPEFKRKSNIPLTENINLNTDKIREKNTELEKSISLLRATLESTADGIMMVNGHGAVVDWNQKFIEMWRIPSYMMESGKESISFEYILEQLIDPQSLIADVQYLYQNPEWQGELPELHFKDGRIYERFTQPQRVGSQIVGRVYSFRDVTQKRMALDELRIRERAIEASTHGVVIIDVTKHENKVIYVNRAFERITGYVEQHALGKSLLTLLGSNLEEVNHKRIELAIRESKEETIEMESIKRNGEFYWCEISVAPVKDSFGYVKHYICILNDVTQRRDMENQLLLQATYDSLTNLPNRVLLIDRVEQAILQARKNKTILAFLFLDLDRFKMTNDTLGHSMGDKLLQAISNRLLIVTEDFDTVARLGGDEFVILLTDIGNMLEAETIAQNILKAIEKPIQIDQHSLKITGSLGISFYPRDGDDYESLMKSADLSMYHAKDNGRNNYRIYEPEMNRRVISHMQLDNALRDALKNDELFLVYQPLIDLKQSRVVGFEALMRWHSKILGLVSPADFIPIAEENGMILAMGEWAMKQACTQVREWHTAGFKNLSIAVNLSGMQFRQKNLPDVVLRVLKSTGLQSRFLELELTESLLIEDIDHVVDTMYVLKDMGTKLVIDDFGTGYSSLSYLKQFPVDKLKIDRSFIAEMASNENDAAIAKAIINLGHSLNLQVLAEGVENEFQRDFIISHGCDYAQGYFYKAPDTPENILEFLKNLSESKIK